MHSKFRLFAKAILVQSLILIALAFSSAPTLRAAPADDLTKAIRASGFTQPADAPAERVLVAYTSVIARVNLRPLPEYVAAAIRLRPDLSAQFTAATIRAAGRSAQNERAVCDVIDRIVRAAILANPDAAVAIAHAAVQAAPAHRSCIVAAAIAAAPHQRLAILEATGASASLAGFFRAAGSEGDFSFGFGSMSPANFSDTGGNVNSPEQPPTRP